MGCFSSLLIPTSIFYENNEFFILIDGDPPAADTIQKIEKEIIIKNELHQNNNECFSKNPDSSKPKVNGNGISRSLIPNDKNNQENAKKNHSKSD